MKLSLKRLFGRSMTGDSNLAETPSPPSPRSAARKTALVSLALVLAIIGALAGGYYFAMRPVTPGELEWHRSAAEEFSTGGEGR